jgi:porin-like protein
MIARTLSLAVSVVMLAIVGAAAGEPKPSDPAAAARPCPEYGAGFVRLPGARTCVRVGGRVRSEVQASGRRIAPGSVVSTRSEGRMEVDTRTPTDYGTVRTFVRVRGGASTGGDAFGR